MVKTTSYAGSFPRPEKIIVTNKNLSRGCGLCELTCSLIHEGSCNPSLSRIQVIKDPKRYEFRLFVCMQCAIPYYMLACPQDAVKLEDGVRVIVEELCNGCGLCAEACPFNSNRNIIFPHPLKGVYLKYDLCLWAEHGPRRAMKGWT